MDFVPGSANTNENPSEDNLGTANFNLQKDNVVISLAQSHRTTRPSQIVYTQQHDSDKSEYYEEWLQKCVAWIAIGSGIRRMDFHSLEKITNYVIKEIKNIGRKAVYFTRVRGCETSNFIDVMNALESVNPSVYNLIFKDKITSKTKQLPKQIPIVPHNTLIQPVVLSQPSALYFECMVNTTEDLSELGKDNEEEADNVYNSMSRMKSKSGKPPRTPESMDMEYYLTYTNRNPYSFKLDEVYQQIATSRPKFLHRHMPMLPPEFLFSEVTDNELSYVPETSKSSERLIRQNMLLQSDLPMLHRVQIEPELEELRKDTKTDDYNKTQ